MKVCFFDKFYYIKNHLLRILLMRKLGYDNKHGYSLVRDSQTLDFFEKIKNGDYFIKQAYDYDTYGFVSQDLGEELEKLFMDEDCIMGIHRTGLTFVNEKVLNDIFSKGLINGGKSMQIGGVRGGSVFDIDNTVSIFNRFQYLISQIKASSGYKFSCGCVILKIPKSCLGLNNNKPLPLFHMANDVCYFKPEYIYGYVPVDSSGNVGTLVHNPNYNKQMVYDNQVYESTVIENAKEILFRNYVLTYNKYNKRQADTALIKFIESGDTRYFTGENNRILLNSRIDIYNCIKRLEHPNGITDSDLQAIIDRYQTLMVQESSHGITK